MEAYKNILCVTDFSMHSEVAAERAVDLTKRYGAQLTVLHVVEYFPVDRSDQLIAPEDVDPAVFREKQARTSLTELVRNLDCEDARQEVLFSPHSAHHEIIRYARNQGIDLIVIGTHGHHGITAILGSTANAVMHSAPCDVLAIRSRV